MALTKNELRALRKIPRKNKSRFNFEKMCRDRIAGLSYSEIAKKHNCAVSYVQSTIRKVASGKLILR